LEYRTLKFENELLSVSNYQGNAVVNYTEATVPWTRIVEHKHFEPGNASKCTYITREIPDVWHSESVPYYPIGDTRNTDLWRKYDQLAKEEPNTIFGGRLAEYRYYDMHQVIGSALGKAKKAIEGSQK
jgi:UDP-galactopyranose mutase